MSFKQMRARCPTSGFMQRVYLEGYKFVYDGYSDNWKGAVGNIINDVGSVVWGGMYEIDDECLRSLDRHEGCPKKYQRYLLKVKDEEQNVYESWVYLRKGKEEGAPSDDYRNTIIHGARDCGLSEDYITRVIMQ